MTQLDAQMQKFVDQSINFYPVDAVAASVEQQRIWYNALCQDFAAPRPKGIVVNDAYIAAKDAYLVPVRHYTCAERDSATGSSDGTTHIVYMHGGGFVVGGLDSHNDICAELSASTGLNLVSVDYRLAPTYQYPDDINDCLTVIDNLLEAGKKVILVGDSAGGTLAACVANARKSYTHTQLLGQVLIYPSLSLGVETHSMKEHAFAPLLTREDMDYYLPIRVGGVVENIPQTDPRYIPMQSLDYKDLPATHLFPAQIDPLHDDCELYAQALRQAGVSVTNHTAVGQGLVHGHLRARNMSDKAAHNFEEICAAVSALAAP